MHASINFALLALATVAIAQESQIGDGQPQGSSAGAAPVTVISDGQPQAPTATVAPVTVISDGQPQAPTATVAPVTVISDGQPQAPTATPVAPIPTIVTSAAPVPPVNSTMSIGLTPTSSSAPIATGAAALFGWSAEIAGAAGVAALAALL